MNIWPVYTKPIEGTLYFFDRTEQTVFLIIEQIFDEQHVIYDGVEIDDHLAYNNLTYDDVRQGILEELDTERNIWTSFFEA